MNFKAFLLEGRDIKEVSYEEIAKLLTSTYSESKRLIMSRHLYRGVKHKPEKFLYSQATTERKPLDGGEYYTPILQSNPLNKDWPKRTRSTICSSSIEKARAFGKSYYVFPKNGIVLAKLDEADIWLTKIPFFEKSENYEKILFYVNTFIKYHIDPKDLKRLSIDNLIDLMKARKLISAEMLKHLESLDLEKIFSYEELGGKLMSIREYANSSGANGEVWFEGPSIMIESNMMIWVQEELDKLE